MAEAFGPLEHFKVFCPSATAAEKGAEALPVEHRSRRSEEMEDGIWEVKWGHRDDCVSAFNVRGSFLILETI